MKEEKVEKKPLIVTIDGPSGVGKGTLGLLLAKALGWHFLESGALYRVLALAAMQHGVALDNEVALELLAAHLDVQFQAAEGPGERSKVLLEGSDVSDLIRTEARGLAASKVSQYAGVRRALLDRQKAFLQLPGLVAEGRDMGTVVFPEAHLKLYLVASAAERAQRRYKQLKEKGISAKLPDLVVEIAERDQRDQQRSVAPLRPAEDAIIIDTTHLNVHDAMLRIKAEVEQGLGLKIQTEF